MNRRNVISLYVLVGITLVLAFATGFVINDYIRLRAGDFPVFNQAYDLIIDHGYSDVPADPAIEYGMIRGMIEAYGDPFTSFVEPARAELDSNNLHGSFGGIGVRTVRESDGSILLYPFPEGPAAIAGIMDADQLVRVTDLKIEAETSMEEVTSAIRGPVGERINIEVLRPPDSTALQFEIIRESVPLPSVTWHISSLDDRIGVVDINIFAASTTAEVEDAVEDLQKRGATHFILDLRDNNGGLLDAGVDIARLFMEDGVVIEQQFRGEAIKTYEVEKPGVLSEIPLILLINQYTASAAEITAGALQNSGRSELVGHPTFGKDSIQLVFELSDKSSIHITAARWWLPGADRSLREGGIEPDLFVSPSETDQDVVMQAAVKRILNQTD
jgi:carboxyl-terminal processing protease